MERFSREPHPSSAAPLDALQPPPLAEERLRHLETALRRRDEILAAVIFAAERFLGPSDWEASIREVLERIGRAGEVDRVDLLQLCGSEASPALLRHEWTSPDADDRWRDPSVAAISGAEGERWLLTVVNREMIHGSAATLPTDIWRALAPAGTRALVVVPVFDGDSCWGALRLVNGGADREWSGIELDALRTAAAALGAALQRRRIDEALRRSEERFRRLAGATTEGIVIHEYGVILDANPSLARIFGYELAEIIGRHVLDFVPEAVDRELVESRIRSGDERPYEIVAARRDGTRIQVEVSSRATSYQGRSVRVAAVRDITDRKALEARTRDLMREQAARAAAEASERRSALLAEASRVLGSSFDYETTLAQLARLAVPSIADYCVVDVVEGPAGFRRVGIAHVDREKEQLLQQETHFSSGVVSQEHPVVRSITTGAPVLVRDVTPELVRNSAISEKHHGLLEAMTPRSLISVPLTVSGRVLGALTLVSADAERRYDADDLDVAVELARRAALAVDNARLFHEAQQATTARDEMLSIVAHDLRNPLGTIGMSSALLLENAADETTRRQLGIMRRAVDRMNRLIQDLIDVRRIERGGLGIDVRPEPLAPLLRDAVDMLRPLAGARSLVLELDAPEPLPLVRADAARIQQVLSNLIGNAIKFTPAGGRITLEARPSDGEVRCAVIDTGPGIPPDQLPHIFGRFWQADRTDRRGIGLGLAIAKGIIEAHHGRIWVESRLGEGSTFYFTLPPA